MRRTLLTPSVLVAVAVLLALAPLSAFAAGPTIIDETVTIPTPYTAFSCGDFNVNVTSQTIERRRILFYDESGTLVREIRHVYFYGSVANSVTGKTFPWDGHFTIHFDYPAGTVTRTGLLLRNTGEGGGVLALNTGRIVHPVGQPLTILDASGHTPAEYQQSLCEALA